MPWGRVDDNLHQSGKVWSLTDKEFRVWWYSVSYCNAKRDIDPEGTLTRAEAEAICRLAAATPSKVIPGLLRVRTPAGAFWDQRNDLYMVHDFTDYGPKRDGTAAERMRRHRNKDRNDVTPVTPSPHMRAKPVPVPVPVDPPSSEDLAQETDLGGNTHSRRASVHGPPRALVRADAAEFEAWWSAYPRRLSKLDAHRAYEKRRKEGRSADALLRAVRRYGDRIDEEGGDLEFVPYPATWLNKHLDEEWEHGPPVPARSPNGHSKKRDEPRGFDGVREAFADVFAKEIAQ